MRWSVEFDERARRDLAALDPSIRRRILDKLDWFELYGAKETLVPLHGEWREFLKLRVGDWRIAYTLDVAHQIMIVHYIDHRSRMYKRRRS
ncbi:MAG: type II toxin-antitoxin system RelE/ParE family toxin [bacterium]|nr:type II toxin-antitoxin system RelE/ParE family toxin [bacterium]